jgi:adenylate kinase family enzyme
VTQPIGIIILEGADGTGKTTLARALCARYDGLYIHMTYRKDIWPWMAASQRWAARESARRLVVVDRHWPSEMIYARVYRKESTIPAAARALHRTWLRLGALYVVCAPRTAHVVETHQRMKLKRKEMYDTVAEVADRYLDLWHGSVARDPKGDLAEQLSVTGGVRAMPNWVHYDVEHEGQLLERHVLPYLADALRATRARAYAPGLDPELWNLSGVVGPDSTLIVGDEVGNPGSAAPWPFYAASNSSLYLMQTLRKLGVAEEKLAYVNVNNPQIRHLLEAAQRCVRIVALGKQAQVGLAKLRVYPHAVARHPQHASRFSHNDDSYRQELGAALQRGDLNREETA